MHKLKVKVENIKSADFKTFYFHVWSRGGIICVTPVMRRQRQMTIEKYTVTWRNWYTRTPQKRILQRLGVRISPWPPLNWLVYYCDVTSEATARLAWEMRKGRVYFWEIYFEKMRDLYSSCKERISPWPQWFARTAGGCPSEASLFTKSKIRRSGFLIESQVLTSSPTSSILIFYSCKK